MIAKLLRHNKRVTRKRTKLDKHCIYGLRSEITRQEGENSIDEDQEPDESSRLEINKSIFFTFNCSKELKHKII